MELFDPVEAAQRPQIVAAGVSAWELDVLFMHFIRFPQHFCEARPFLRLDFFEPVVEAQYRLLWLALCEVWDRYRSFHYPSLVGKAQELADAGAVVITEACLYATLRPDAHGLVWLSFYSADAEFQLSYSQDVFRRFCRERQVARPLQRLLAQTTPGEYPQELSTFLSGFHAADQRIDSFGQQEERFQVMPPVGTDVAPAQTLNPTGVPFIDNQLGGMGEGHVNGVLGVIGGGKTTLAVHMGVTMAKTEWEIAAEADRLPRWVMFFTYEEPGPALRGRVISAAAWIRREKAENLRNTNELTTSENMEEYERRLSLQPPGRDPRCEQERYQDAALWMEQCFYLKDMSGDVTNAAIGAGGVSEIATCVSQLIERTGRGVVAIIVDWAGLCCSRHVAAHNLRDDKLRILLTAFAEDCKRLIAVPFNCTTWVFHQLKSDVGNRAPTKLMHHTESSESKAFATHMAFCGCLGVPSRTTGCIGFQWSKTRHRRREDVRPVTLRINDNFARMDDVTELFRADEANNQFIRRDDWAALHGEADTPPGSMAGPSGYEAPVRGALPDI